MTKKQTDDNNIKVTVGGDVSGQLAAGQNIKQASMKTTDRVTESELQELHLFFQELRTKVEAEAEPKKKVPP